MRRSGRASRLALAAVALLLASACRYGYGFAGGGLPAGIRTAAVLPFDNNTPVAELQREVVDALRGGLERRLGLRSAPESRANAVVRGAIVSYDADIAVAYSADPAQATSARRRLAVTVDVEIVDQRTSQVLFARKGVRGEAEYAEGGEAIGRRRAIENIVSDVITGAQSQW
jgi:hypothetical protein